MYFNTITVLSEDATITILVAATVLPAGHITTCFETLPRSLQRWGCLQTFPNPVSASHLSSTPPPQLWPHTEKGWGVVSSSLLSSTTINCVGTTKPVVAYGGNESRRRNTIRWCCCQSIIGLQHREQVLKLIPSLTSNHWSTRRCYARNLIGYHQF